MSATNKTGLKTGIKTPTLVSTRTELRRARGGMKGAVAVVMTMGALHEGHAKLMREARASADKVIVTIFVNPLQFGANEDLDRYPRTLEHDLEICAREGVDLVFAPTPDVVYPQDPLVRISAGPMGERFEGAIRPGHFDGVLTVVSKLLQLTKPQVAYFGQKDGQQLALIRRMVLDLDLNVTIVGVPTVREQDGLALSSRNVYLSPEQRVSALAISRALRAGEGVADEGVEAILTAARTTIGAEAGLVPDYMELVDPSDFAPVSAEHSGVALLIAAARCGSTRLIDNVELYVSSRKA
jgi:pantoate--beta-alanine ligase